MGVLGILRMIGFVGVGEMSWGELCWGRGYFGFYLLVLLVFRSVVRTTMTDVSMFAVSRSFRRLYCCCVNIGVSSLTFFIYIIICGSRVRVRRLGWSRDWGSLGLGLFGFVCVVIVFLG